jgi:hypothetical protein
MSDLTSTPAKAEEFPHTIEYGDPRSRTHAAKSVLLADAPHQRAHYSAISFCHLTAGYVPAGSAMTYQKECFKVTWWDEAHGTRHGQAFLPKDRESAELYFNKVRDQEKSVIRYDSKEALPPVPSLAHVPVVADTVAGKRAVTR